ncbi:MAG: hypothetical protein IJE62_03105 [Clostridia bacterium]|nr:hypothetical protein [Clostridia bacterium]
MNDIFVEEIVKKQNTAVDKLAMFGLVLLSVVLSVILFFVSALIPQFSSIMIGLIVIAVYFTYILSGDFNLEYEYALVNSEIDVDKIAAKKRRKKLTSVNLRRLDFFGKSTGADFEKCLKDVSIKKVFACRQKKSEDNYFLVYSEDATRKMLIFSPSDEIISVIEKLNPKRY